MRDALVFEHILTPRGLAARQRICIDAQGRIAAIEPAGRSEADGYLAVPGMPNAHSHSFQRAMAGYGEAVCGDDSFWSWRETMYALARDITAAELHAIASQAFADMLRGGYTSVAEFHYLHHLPDGSRSPAMAESVIAAARDTGIGLVMLPVLYLAGGFGRDPQPAQRRFVHDSTAEFCELLATVAATGVACGIAPHSLRAVPADRLGELLSGARAVLGDGFPVHMHIAEQRGEVEECIAACGLSPVRLLAATVELDERWSLVHATHADDEELALLRRAGARVVICPLTEAYLGDGIFPSAEFLHAGGQLAVGSDSNVRIDALEELRMLEYVQRLVSRRRARHAGAGGLGVSMWRHAARAGAAALRLPAGALEPGLRADIVVFDASEPPLHGPAPERAMDALLTGGSARNVRDVYVCGRQCVSEGQVAGGPDIGERFAKVVARLLGT